MCLVEGAPPVPVTVADGGVRVGDVAGGFASAGGAIALTALGERLGLEDTGLAAFATVGGAGLDVAVDAGAQAKTIATARGVTGAGLGTSLATAGGGFVGSLAANEVVAPRSVEASVAGGAGATAGATYGAIAGELRRQAGREQAGRT